MSFKIIALRPLSECDTSYTKILKRNEFYVLHGAFSFSEYKDEINEIISYNPQLDFDLYSSNGASININAIVGKNGTGKSSLAELLYAFIFCLSRDKNVGFLRNIKVKEDHEFTIEESKKYDDEVKKMNGLKLEIFYLIKDKIFRIRKERNFYIKQFELKDNIFIPVEETELRLSKKFIAENFFYSIAVNYSLYGLNTKEIGLWLKPLFHKNDAYQTPLVLNPMRTEGIIDINKVTYLSKSRLLSNILRPIPQGSSSIDSLRNLVNDKVVHKLVLQIDHQKFAIYKSGKNKGKIRFDYFSKYSKKILYKVLNAFSNLKQEKKSISEINRKYRTPNQLDKITIEYILHKIEKIAKTYPIDGKIYGEKFNLKEDRLVTALLDDLENEFSHITFKLRQAVNFLLYGLDSIDKDSLFHSIDNDILSLNIDKLITDLVEKDKQEQLEEREEDKRKGLASRVLPEGTQMTLPKARFELINFLPPSFFELDILFEDMGSFSELSSGERQKVYSINSIVYHLVNLKSVDGTTKVRYDYVNLIFDEVELYFHPEFQRTFIKDLISYILRTNYIFSGINITFITHSPFILSDIPNSNILFLDIPKDSKLAEPKKNTEQTFAANIHELLSNGFFMRYTKGEVALEKISELIDFYEKVKQVSEEEKLEELRIRFKDRIIEFEKLCSMIGEKYIKEILENNLSYIEKRLGIYSKNTIAEKIKNLNTQIEALETLKKMP
ncbi:hypothetical protein GGR22_002900 [Flavobacterium gossypii]|uniref:ATPase AAA-type core domain-containing protein n=1 Tax=Flavobacterium gossypii TaxID=1646119 RepID=A0ABR6DSQ2_9FLAO|nr:hypothetical protein [Flavobacterium gossypii]MBA9074727.1 hypothetical protein [Flavobacterium gossypii]